MGVGDQNGRVSILYGVGDYYKIVKHPASVY